MAIYQGNKIIAGAGAGSYRNIGEIVPSLIPLSDAGLHLLDGAQISGTGVYAEFFNYIGTLVSAYPNLFCTEAQWQTSVSAYGVCGKFVYDSVNNTVRLPKITGIIEGTTDTTALGDLVEAGLPNITGSGVTSEVVWPTAITATRGAFRLAGNNLASPDRALPNSGNQTGYAWWEFDASLSNSTYSNSSTVQPQTIKAYYYIVVANSTKLSIQANLDGIASDLNLKAGTDLANLTNQGSIVAAKASMPSSTYDDLTLGASGTEYTAPADGWFAINKSAGSANLYLTMANKSNNMQTGNVYAAAGQFRCYIPAKKGDKVVVYYSMTGTTNMFRFIYAEGSKSEQ